MTSCPCQETSHTAITLNPESSFTRREKNHSLFHWSTLTYPELLTRIWMSRKKNASMISGISMGLETCHILGQMSHNLLFWKKNLQTDICGPGRDYRENSLHPGQIIYGQSSGRKWERMPSWRRSKSGHMKSSIWITHENCEESTSLTLRMRKSRKPSRMLVRNRKHQFALAMPCKIMKKNCGIGASNKIKTRRVYSGSLWISKDNTSKDPFSRCVTCKNYGCSLSWRWHDIVGLQHQEENLEVRMRGETERWDVRHQWQRENQDQHKAHETRHLTSECARSLLVSSCCVCVVIFTHCTPHRVAQVVRVFVSSHPCVKWASLFDFELSIPSNFLLSLISNNLKQFLLPFHFHEDK